MSIFGSIVAGATALGSKVAFALTPYAPAICLGTGLVAGACALISAGKDTLTAEEILAEDAAHMEAIKQAWELSLKEIEEARQEGREVNPKRYYSKKTMNIQIFETKRTLMWKLAGHYKRTIILALIAGASLIVGHYILSAELARALAAEAGLAATLTAYRKNVVADQGQAKDYEYMYGLKETRTTTSTETENGQEIVEEKSEYELGLHPGDLDCSMYAQPFYDINPNFDESRLEDVRNFIAGVEKQADNKLHHVGHLYLNDVYRMFGMEQTELGHDHGWTMDSENGDHFVRLTAVEFKYLDCNGGVHYGYMIDFNCDGDIKHRFCTSKFQGCGVGKINDYKYPAAAAFSGV